MAQHESRGTVARVPTQESATPRRIQRKRTKGSKMPENTVYVGRPTIWGNPYRVGMVVHRGPTFSGRDERLGTIEAVVNEYRVYLDRLLKAQNPGLLLWIRGKNLACWCPLDQPCHADVLLEIANARKSK